MAIGLSLAVVLAVLAFLWKMGEFLHGRFDAENPKPWFELSPIEKTDRLKKFKWKFVPWFSLGAAGFVALAVMRFTQLTSGE